MALEEFFCLSRGAIHDGQSLEMAACIDRQPYGRSSPFIDRFLLDQCLKGHRDWIIGCATGLARRRQGATEITSQLMAFRFDPGHDGRTRIFRSELAELPLATQCPKRIVHAGFES